MLTPDQLVAIDSHLRKENWLLNEDLIAELTDHYITAVEERLADGMPFDAALRDIHTGFGGRKGLLDMEEEYKAQKFRQLDLKEWQLVQSFMYGSRWYISVGVFISLFLYTRQQEIIEPVSIMSFFYVTSAVFGHLLRVIVVFYQNRRDVNQASLNATSPLFIGAYLATASLLLAEKYLFPTYRFHLSDLSVSLLNTLLQTLCIVYYIAVAVAIKQVLLDNRKTRLKTT